MAETKSAFVRRPSSEEVQGNFITIQKRELEFFPKPGKPFKLKCNGDEVEVFIGLVDCWCQGPQKPHSHYRLDLSAHREKIRLKWGRKIRIEREKEGTYQISL